jgi:hypothetical protein
MSDATDFMTSQMNQIPAKPGVVSFVTCQRVQVPPPGFTPGIASYGWGVNGRIEADGTGRPIGLRFPSVYQWFSDRIANAAQAQFPSDWQQFEAAGRDKSDLILRLAGDQIQLDWHSQTWGNTWTALTSTFDSASELLTFAIPGAGPGAPSALMLLSICPHGEEMWL